jgi:hypothetical protein
MASNVMSERSVTPLSLKQVLQYFSILLLENNLNATCLDQLI